MILYLFINVLVIFIQHVPQVLNNTKLLNNIKVLNNTCASGIKAKVEANVTSLPATTCINYFKIDQCY